MRLLVTGGLGFIGARFVLAAARDPRVTSVVVLDSFTYAADPSRLSELGNPLPQVVRASIGDEETIISLVNDFDCVVNFAAETHNDRALESPQKFWDTNVVQLSSLAKICAKYKVHLHQVSTDEVFGDTPFGSRKKFRPDSELRPSNPYSASKAAGELMLAAYSRSFGLEYTLSNCSNNFGPGQHSEKFVPTVIRSLASGDRIPIYGSGKNVRDWINVDDHVEGILEMIFSPFRNISLLFGANDEVSNLDFAKTCASYFGVDPLRAIQFIEDRAGHDRRYAIDATRTNEVLGWFPKRPKLLDSIPILIRQYGK